MNEYNNEHIKDLRVKKGFTQQQVADYLGVTKATISKYETGQRRIKGEYMKKLATLFEVDPFYILTGVSADDWKTLQEKEVENAHQEERSYWETVLLTDAVLELMPILELLNEDGRQKAVERVAELTEIPRYQRSSEG